MLSHKDVEELMPLLLGAVLKSLEAVGEAKIKSGPFFGSGEYRRPNLKEAA